MYPKKKKGAKIVYKVTVKKNEVGKGMILIEVHFDEQVRYIENHTKKLIELSI